MRPLSFRLLLATSALALTPMLAVAQFPADIQPGVRVQVSLPEAYRQMNGPGNRLVLRGVVESVSSDTMRLNIPGVTGTVAIGRGAMRRLDVSRGAPSRGISAVERAIGGAFVGAITFALANNRSGDWPNYGSDWRAAGDGALIGAGVGVIAGVLFPYERWRHVRLR